MALGFQIVLEFGKERGKPEFPEKNLSEQGQEPTKNSTHVRRRVRESNPGYIGERPAWKANAQPLGHPCPLTVGSVSIQGHRQPRFHP